MSAKDALLKYHQRQLKSTKRTPRKKNKKPEKVVEKDCLDWLDKHGFSINVVESKAVYSKAAGNYIRGQTVAGFPDLVGNDKDGHAVFIELKAPGKRSTIRPAQVDFLLNKIKTNCFAVCVDSVAYLSTAYALWSELEGENAKEYLHSLLPKKRKDDSPLF